MKKILLLFLLAGVELTGYGQGNYSGLEADPGFAEGKQLFSVFVGLAYPRGTSGVRVGSDGEELNWGDSGVQYGVEVINFATPYIGYGAELSGMSTTYAVKNVTGTNYKNVMDLWNGMLRLRLNINPYNRVRVYVPAGGGMTYARSRCYASTQQESNVGRSVSFGYFVGIGLETDWARSGQSVGLEVRYHGFEFDTDKIVDGQTANGNKNYGYMSVLLKLNYRF